MGFQILIFILCIIFLFFPIIIWAYIFSYIDENIVEKKRFLGGIFLGAGALLPLLFLEKITYYFPFFDVLSSFAGAETLTTFSLGFTIFLLFFLSFFIYSLFFNIYSILLNPYNFFQHLRKNLYPLYSVLGIVFFVSFFLYFLHYLYPRWYFFQNIQVFDFPSFQDVWFDTAFLVILYYIIVATIEEISKYFMSLRNQHISQNITPQSLLFGALFVALGFAFIENIFYTQRFLISGTSGVFGLMIFRSIFSTLLHVICTITFFSGTVYFFLKDKQTKSSHLFSSILAGCGAIAFHTFYNISLSYGYFSIVILSIVIGYFYLSYLFTRS